MFFAETLGPALTERSADALVRFLADRAGARATLSVQELKDIVGEFVRLDGERLSVAAATGFLARRNIIIVSGDTIQLASDLRKRAA